MLLGSWVLTRMLEELGLSHVGLYEGGGVLQVGKRSGTAAAGQAAVASLPSR